MNSKFGGCHPENDALAALFLEIEFDFDDIGFINHMAADEKSRLETSGVDTTK